MEKYEAITQSYYDSLNSNKRYPEAKLNIESSDESGLKYLIEDGLNYFYFENYFTKSNNKISIGGERRQNNDLSSKKIVLAGGYFTQYVDSSPIAHAFPQLYDYFKRKQDIDIWITLESELFFKLGYHLSKRIGMLNIISTACPTPVDLFDFECCKIWRKPFSPRNEIYVAKTLLDSVTVIKNEPTFTQGYSGSIFRCDCEGNLRKLKYLFKNCYNIANSENEIKIAKNIFNTKKCLICERNYLQS